MARDRAAGSAAQLKHDEQVRSWRRRHTKLFTVVAGSDLACRLHVRRATDLSYVNDAPSRVQRLAIDTSRRILATSRIRQWVTPVVVIWAEFPQVVVEGDCAVVHGDELVAWLRRQPDQIATRNLQRIAAAVGAAWSVDQASGESPQD